MSFTYGALLKVCGYILAGSAAVGSGVGVGAMIEPREEYKLVEKRPIEAQESFENARVRITTIDDFEHIGLKEEKTIVSSGGKAHTKFMKNLVNGKNEESAIYLVNKKGDTIRLSLTKPDSEGEEEEVFFTGWILNEFKHPNFKKIVFYGYCSPIDQICQHLPEG